MNYDEMEFSCDRTSKPACCANRIQELESRLSASIRLREILDQDLEAYKTLVQRQAELLERCKEVLRYYGNHMNYSVDYDTSQMGFSRRCILYGDIEQRNEATGLAGMRARAALKDLAALGGE